NITVSSASGEPTVSNFNPGGYTGIVMTGTITEDFGNDRRLITPIVVTAGAVTVKGIAWAGLTALNTTIIGLSNVSLTSGITLAAPQGAPGNILVASISGSVSS